MMMTRTFSLLLTALLAGVPCFAGADTASSIDAWTTGGDALRQGTRAYLDPSSDFPWSAGYSVVSDIQSAFNAARTNENSQLGTSLPSMKLPSQSAWDGYSSGQKALWLINTERNDRKITPLYGVESNVSSVAQAYADHMLTTNCWGHNCNGSPGDRLKGNTAINNCNDGFMGENIFFQATDFGTTIDLPVEQAVYMWMYEDGSCCSWGHRHLILSESYNNNNGDGWEGFLGIGHAQGGPYQTYNYAEIIVMNVFDPCATWDYSKEPPPWTPGNGPVPTPPPGSNSVTLTVSEATVSPGGAVTLNYSCNPNAYNYWGVPVNIFLAVIRAPVVVNGPSTVGDALNGGTVYLYQRGMIQYVYAGAVYGPTFRYVPFPPVPVSGAVTINVPTETGTYVFAAAFAFSDGRGFVRTDGKPVENSNSFTVQ